MTGHSAAISSPAAGKDTSHGTRHWRISPHRETSCTAHHGLLQQVDGRRRCPSRDCPRLQLATWAAARRLPGTRIVHAARAAISSTVPWRCGGWPHAVEAMWWHLTQGHSKSCVCVLVEGSHLGLFPARRRRGHRLQPACRAGHCRGRHAEAACPPAARAHR